jgi:hypothetical protein
VTQHRPDNVRRLRGIAGPAGGPGRRLRANWPAELRAEGGLRIKCIIIDLSGAGARVRLEDELGDVRHVRLVIGTLPPIAATLAWRTLAEVGLRFAAEQGWVLDLCAQRFDPAAWLRPR